MENLGIGLSKQGKKVLLIDADPQASLTISLGYPQPDDLEPTLSDLLNGTISENPVALDEVLIHQQEGIDLIPSNISLVGLEVSLVNTMNRERILKQFLETLREDYDYILLDCVPSLGMLTVNALAASDATLVPVQANYLSAKGLERRLLQRAKDWTRSVWTIISFILPESMVLVVEKLEPKILQKCLIRFIRRLLYLPC